MLLATKITHKLMQSWYYAQIIPNISIMLKQIPSLKTSVTAELTALFFLKAYFTFSKMCRKLKICCSILRIT